MEDEADDVGVRGGYTATMVESSSQHQTGYNLASMEALSSRGGAGAKAEEDSDSGKSSSATSESDTDDRQSGEEEEQQEEEEEQEEEEKELDPHEEGVVVSAVMRKNSRVASFLLHALESSYDFARDASLAKMILQEGGPRNTARRESRFVWAKRFDEAMAEQDPNRQLTALSILRSDFLDTCRLYGSVICQEACLPDSDKTIQPVALGGIAGGSKFMTHGILFKFARDPLLGGIDYLYGGSKPNQEAASKAMGNELKAVGALFKAAEGTKLRVPLMAILDYRGFRLCCQALLPISEEVVYGSANGGAHVFDGSNFPELRKDIDIISSRLNLASHPVMEWSTKTVKNLSLPVDIEIHAASDKSPFFFALDVARLMPPTAPQQGQERRIFCELFRPEFVRRYEIPLSSDCFSRFGLSGAKEHEPVAIAATRYLCQRVIPEFASTLHEHLDRLSFRFREAGINMRYLGLVRHHCTHSGARQVLMEEMLARVLKKQLDTQLRDLVAKVAAPVTFPYQELCVQFFENIASAAADSKFWCVKAKKAVVNKFGECALGGDQDKERSKKFSLLYSVRSVDQVLRLLAIKSGITTARPLLDVARMNFLALDFDFEPVLKEMQITTVAMAQSLIVQAKGFGGVVRRRLLEEALQVLSNEVAASPSDVSLVLKLCSCEIALCFDPQDELVPMDVATEDLSATTLHRLQQLLSDPSCEGWRRIEPLYLVYELLTRKVAALLCAEQRERAAFKLVMMNQIAKEVSTMDVATANFSSHQFSVLHAAEAWQFVGEVESTLLQRIADILSVLSSNEEVNAVVVHLGPIWRSLSPESQSAVLILSAAREIRPRKESAIFVEERSLHNNLIRSSGLNRRHASSAEALSAISFYAISKLSGEEFSPMLSQYLSRFEVCPVSHLCSLPVDNEAAKWIMLQINPNSHPGIDFTGCKVTDDVASYMNFSPSYINMSDTKIGDGFLRTLADRDLLKHVQSLFLDGTQSRLVEIRKAPRLEILSLAKCPVRKEDLVGFCRNALNPLLSNLCLSSTDCVSKESLQALSAGFSLQILDMSFACFGSALQALRMPSLRVLKLSKCRLRDGSLERIAHRCPELRELDLSNNSSLSDGVFRHLSPLGLITLSLVGCVLISDKFVRAISGLEHFTLKRLNLTDCSSVSKQCILSLMDAHPSCLATGGSEVPIEAVLVPDFSESDDGAEDSSSFTLVNMVPIEIPKKSGLFTRHPSIAQDWKRLDAALLLEKFRPGAVIDLEGSTLMRGKFVDHVCDAFRIRYPRGFICRGNGGRILPHDDDVPIGASIEFVGLRGLLLDICSIPRRCLGAFVEQQIQCKSSGDPAKASLLRALLWGISCGHGGADDLTRQAVSYACSLFRDFAAKTPVLLEVDACFLDTASSVLLTCLVELRVPGAAILIHHDASFGGENKKITASVQNSPHYVRIALPTSTKEISPNLEVAVMELPVVLHRTLCGASVLGDRSVDVDAVSFVMHSRPRDIIAELTMLCELPLPLVSSSGEAGDEFIVTKSVRQCAMKRLESQFPDVSVSLYRRAVVWLQRRGTEPLRWAKLMLRAAALVPHDVTIRQLALVLCEQALRSVTLQNFDAALAMYDVILPLMDMEGMVPTMRSVVLKLLQKHVQLLHFPWGICSNKALVAASLEKQACLHDILHSDDSLQLTWLLQKARVRLREQFVLPFGLDERLDVGELRQLRQFAQCENMAPLQVQQLIPWPCPCGATPIATAVSLQVRHLTLSGDWRAARMLLDDARSFCRAAEKEWEGLVVEIEACTWYMGFRGDVDGAIMTALNAHSTQVRLFPSLPPHPLVEHFFVPLRVYRLNPEHEAISMLRLMATLPERLPLFASDALALLAVSGGAPPFLLRQIGIELSLYAHRYNHRRYNCVARYCAGVVDKSLASMQGAIEEATSTGQRQLLIYFLKAATMLVTISSADRLALVRRYEEVSSVVEGGPTAGLQQLLSPRSRQATDK